MTDTVATREQNIAARRGRIRTRQLERKYSEKQIDLFAVQIANGATVDSEHHEAVRLRDVDLHTAAVAQKNGDVDTVLELVFKSERVHRVLRMDAADIEREIARETATAAEAARKAAELATEEPAPFIAPKRTDSTLASVYQKETAFYPMRSNWRATTDPITGETIPRSEMAFSKRVNRHMKRAITTAAEQETNLYYVTLPEGEHKKVLAKIQQANNYLKRKGEEKPYSGQSYPLSSGDVVFIVNEATKDKIHKISDITNSGDTSDMGTTYPCHLFCELPIDDTKRLKSLMREWVDTPHGRSAPAFNGYGQKYKGTRGDARPKDELKERRGELVAQVVVRATKEQIETAYSEAGYTVEHGYFGHCHVVVPAEKSIEIITAQFTAYSRESHQDSYWLLLACLPENQASGAADPAGLADGLPVAEVGPTEEPAAAAHPPPLENSLRNEEPEELQLWM